SQPPDQGYPALAITSHRVSDTVSQGPPSDDDSQNSTGSEDSSTIVAESESEEALVDISELFITKLQRRILL
ncbi:hypothetical protein A2U01_0069588, partial [Trifolium medium]|nr:hypothetical protein [Trifolium medium]